MKKQKSIRMSKLTDRQLSALIEETGMSQTELISTAIDRMFREEKMNMTGEQLFDLFVDGGTTTEEIAKMKFVTIVEQIREMRGNEPDNLLLSTVEIATRILHYSL